MINQASDIFTLLAWCVLLKHTPDVPCIFISFTARVKRQTHVHSEIFTENKQFKPSLWTLLQNKPLAKWSERDNSEITF